MNIKIKRLETEEEIRGKAFVHWKSWHDTYPGLVSQAYLDSLTLETCEQRAFNWKGTSIIATENNQVIGFIDYDVREKNNQEIFALYVLSEYRHKGVGHELMKTALDHMDEKRQVNLWVLKENQGAICFYQKCGFQPNGAEKLSESIAAVGIQMMLIR